MKKIKSKLLTCPAIKIYSLEEVGLSVSIILLNYDFCEYVKFEAIS